MNKLILSPPQGLTLTAKRQNLERFLDKAKVDTLVFAPFLEAVADLRTHLNQRTQMRQPTFLYEQMQSFEQRCIFAAQYNLQTPAITQLAKTSLLERLNAYLAEAMQYDTIASLSTALGAALPYCYFNKTQNQLWLKLTQRLLPADFIYTPLLDTQEPYQENSIQCLDIMPQGEAWYILLVQLKKTLFNRNICLVRPTVSTLVPAYAA